MHFKFKIFPNDKLILQKWEGEFNLAKIVDCNKQCQLYNNYNRDYKLIADYRKAKINVSEDKVEVLVKQLESTKLLRNKIAVLIDDPQNTVVAMLYSFEVQKKEIKIFNTLTAASRWLGISEQNSKLAFFN
jgi:hypothetical protein